MFQIAETKNASSQPAFLYCWGTWIRTTIPTSKVLCPAIGRSPNIWDYGILSFTDPKSAVLPIKLSPRIGPQRVGPERVRGLEPLTCCLGSNRSTTELYPRVWPII